MSSKRRLRRAEEDTSRESDVYAIQTHSTMSDGADAVPEASEFKSNLNSRPNLNSYSYQYNSMPPNARYKPKDYIKLKLSDLVDPDRNKTFIDHLYAQFQANSNQISLVYVPPGEKVPDNTMLLGEDLASTQSGNKLLNEFYLIAAKQKSTSKTVFFMIYSEKINAILRFEFLGSLWVWILFS